MVIRRRKTFSARHSNPVVHQKTADARRGSSTERGYDSRWQRYRKIFLDSYPFCIACVNLPCRSCLIDHIIPVRQSDSDESGGADPLFWVTWNHQPLCRMHHAIKTNTVDAEISFNRTWLLNHLTEEDDNARRQQLILLSRVWKRWLDLRDGSVIEAPAA